MKEMIGTCFCCGQSQVVNAESQDDADRIATFNCKCDEGKEFRREQKLKENLEGIAGEESKQYGFKPVPEKTLNMLYFVSEFVLKKTNSESIIRYRKHNNKDINKCKGRC